MSSESLTISVLGGGSFGTTIANILTNNGHKVCLWMRDEQVAEEINQHHKNSKYLEGIALNPALIASTSLNDSVKDASLVFMAVPSASCRDVAVQLRSLIEPDAAIISTTKGIEKGSFKLMSQILAEECPQQGIGVLSGPNLAKEIAQGHLAGSVIASESESLNSLVQSVLRSSSFRVYASSDMYGVELAGALKNIYAIMSGMADALEVGSNTVGLLLTRSLAEMSRFAVAMGANPLTFLGLSGVGDLFVTCTSSLSRNYRVGYRLGKGESLEAIIDDLGQVAEGINTLKMVIEKSEELDIYMPLASAMYSVLYQGCSIAEVIEDLMLGKTSLDVEFVTL